MRLRGFQRVDVDRMKAAGLRALLASEMGTGKTPMAIMATVEHPDSLPALVVCPASVTRNWVKELERWAPWVEPILVEGMDDRLPQRDYDRCFFILSWAILDARWEELAEVGVQTVIADEVHAALNGEALRTRAFSKLIQTVPHRLCLTGTPIINVEGELQTLKAYIGTKKPLMIRRLLDDVAPDIPEKKRSYVHIRLRDRHRRLYDKAQDQFAEWLADTREDLEEDGFTEAEIARTVATSALARVGKLRQLVGQFKVPAAADWIARAVRLGEPVVVFVEHQAVLKKLSKALRKQRIRHGILEGATTSKERQLLIEAFQAYQFPVFICTRAGTEGITLTAARHLLFVERYFTSAAEEQAENRVRRIGQKHKTTMWYLHTDNTIDDRLDQIVGTKRQIVKAAIASADTAETPQGNVQQLLQAWGNHVEGPRGKMTNLGLGDPLEPLPSPSKTYAILFTGRRWSKPAAKLWCKMNGFDIQQQVSDLGDRLRLQVHPATVFTPGSFTLFRVARDVKIILGERVNRSNERTIRRAMDGRKLPRSQRTT